MFHVKHIVFLILFLPIVAVAQHLGTTMLPEKNLLALPLNSAQVLQFLDTSSEYTLMSAAQKEWFYWTNYSRNNPKAFWDSVVAPILETYPTLKNSNTVSLKSDLYNVPSLPLLKPNNKLLSTSKTLAKELAAKNLPPSHTSPSGTTFPQRMKALGIVNCAGENISSGPLNPVLMLVLLYIDNGVPGLGHRHALLNPSFAEMGIGYGTYPDNSSIVVQDFACNQK